MCRNLKVQLLIKRGKMIKKVKVLRCNLGLRLFSVKEGLKVILKILVAQNMDGNINKEGSSMTEETLVTLMKKNVKWYMLYALYT